MPVSGFSARGFGGATAISRAAMTIRRRLGPALVQSGADEQHRDDAQKRSAVKRYRLIPPILCVAHHAGKDGGGEEAMDRKSAGEGRKGPESRREKRRCPRFIHRPGMARSSSRLKCSPKVIDAVPDERPQCFAQRTFDADCQTSAGALQHSLFIDSLRDRWNMI
jgi:hypothetical protein